MSKFGYDSGSSRRRRGLLGKLWSIVTWPFRMIEKVEAKVVQWADGRRRSFRHKYRHSKVVAPLVEMLVWLVLLPFRIVWSVVSFPFRLIGGTAWKAGARRSRQLVHLLQGLPAIVAGIGVFVVLMMLAVQAEDLPQEYLQQAQHAYTSESYKRAEVYLNRVLQLDSDSTSASYMLARTLEQTGQPRRSLAILDSLAPDDRPGDPRAHLRKAEILFTQLRARMDDKDPSNNPTPEDLSALLKHLQYAEGGQGFTKQQMADLNYFRGYVLLRMDNTEEAIACWEEASEVRPEINFELAEVYRTEGQSGRAIRKAELAGTYFEGQLKKNQGDTESRIKLAAIQLQNNQFDEAIGLLSEGIQLAPSERLKGALAEALIHRYDSLPPETDVAVRMALLERAVEIDPKSMAAFNRLLSIGSSGNKQAARDLLERLIAVGASAPLAHFALGLMAWDDAETGDAVWHFERAYKLDADLAVLANNLAWVLAHNEEDPELERALELINSVLEAFPDRLAYVETRGQIYVRMGRWEEALDDLERALPQYTLNPELHDSLALVYEMLGQPGLASKHTNVAANLRRLEEQRTR